MENKEIVVTKKGVKVSVLSAVFVVIGLITMIASFFASKMLYEMYDEMADAYQFAETEREAASEFSEASDYLTAQARQFAVTGNIENVTNYFEEIDVIKRRDTSLAFIEKSHALELESELLHDAMDRSEYLVNLEVHAMKLVAQAKGLDTALLPSEVVSFKLPEEEAVLSAERQQNLAIQLLYSNDYEEHKSKIGWDIENAIKLIKDESGMRFHEDESDLIRVLNITTMLSFFMFILLVLIFIFNTVLVVDPAKKFVELLDKKEKLPEIGGYEFRMFARKYNDIYRSNNKNRELLREQGEVDELTGTLKVSTLEFVRHNLSQSSEPLGIMLIDIDGFRAIKENDGYDMADKVVAKVAGLVLEAFKGSDYIIRTGQDTFEVFLLRMQKSDSEMLTERMAQINQKLQDTADGIAAASVSVGVAFSEKGYTEEVARNADMALNSVKGKGRGNCKIM